MILIREDCVRQLVDVEIFLAADWIVFEQTELMIGVRSNTHFFPVSSSW
jgi:hypothetical protein